MSEPHEPVRDKARNADGHSALRWIHRARGESRQTTVVILPALGVPGRYYVPLADALAGAGCDAVRIDPRGQGSSSARPKQGHNFGYAKLVSDAEELVAGLRCALPENRLVILGHSLGGHVGALVAAGNRVKVDGVAIVACGTPYVAAFPLLGGLPIRAICHLVRLSRLLGYYPGRRIGFGGDEALLLMEEWAHLAETGELRVDGKQMEPILGEAQVPVLALTIPGDRYAPPRSTRHLLDKLRRAEKTVRVFAANELASEACDHFRWVKQPGPIVEAVCAWSGGLAQSRAPLVG